MPKDKNRNKTSISSTKATNSNSFNKEECHSDDSSIFELDEKNLFMCLNQAKNIAPNITREAFDEGVSLSDTKEGNCPSSPRNVVILRDFCIVPKESNLIPDEEDENNNYSASKALKEKMRKHKLKSYIISVPNLLKDLQAIQILKDGKDQFPRIRVNNAYKKLIFSILENKIKLKADDICIIIELEKKSWISRKVLKEFCEMACKSKVQIIDRKDPELFEERIEKLTKRICRINKANKKRKNDKDASKLINNLSIYEISQKPLASECSCPAVSASCTSEISELIIAESELEIGPDEVKPTESEQHFITTSIDDVVKKLISATELGETITEKTESEITICNNNNATEQIEDAVTSPREISDDNLCSNGFKALVKVRRKRRQTANDTDVQRFGNTPINEESETDSEDSLNISLLFAQRPRLFTIHLTPDESQYPSSIFTRFPMSRRQSEFDESFLYKGWIALPATGETMKATCEAIIESSNKDATTDNISKRKLLSKVSPKIKRVGELVMRTVMRPMGSLFLCNSCRESEKNDNLTTRQRRIAQESYPRILLHSNAFDQKN